MVVRVAVAVGLGSTAVEVGESLGVGEEGGSSGVRLGVRLGVGVELTSSDGEGVGVLVGLAVGSSESGVGVSEASMSS